MRKIYEGLGVANDLAFFEMNPRGFEHIRIGDETFDLPSGKGAMVERFKTCFPDQSKGIESYFRLLDTVCKEMACIPETKSLIDFLTVPFRTWNMGRYGLYSLERILRYRISDPLLRSFLSIQCGDHGLPPSRIPFLMHAPVAGHYIDGACYPHGGAGTIPNAMIMGLRKEGGDIRLSTEVEKILIEKKGSRLQAIGVRLAGGAELRSGRVVSNASPHITYDRLVGREHLSLRLRRKLDRTRYSMAALTLFLATDLNLVSMGMDSGNYWYVPDRDLELVYARALDPDTVNDPLPAIFFGITSIKDPSSFKGGHHTIEAVRFITYEAFSAYMGSTPGKATRRIRGFKGKLPRPCSDQWNTSSQVSAITCSFANWELHSPTTIMWAQPEGLVMGPRSPSDRSARSASISSRRSKSLSLRSKHYSWGIGGDDIGPCPHSSHPGMPPQ